MSNAYEILGDPEKRRQYDFERSNPSSFGSRKSSGGFRGHPFESYVFRTPEDIFREFFHGMEDLETLFGGPGPSNGVNFFSMTSALGTNDHGGWNTSNFTSTSTKTTITNGRKTTTKTTVSNGVETKEVYENNQLVSRTTRNVGGNAAISGTSGGGGNTFIKYHY